MAKITDFLIAEYLDYHLLLHSFLSETHKVLHSFKHPEVVQNFWSVEHWTLSVKFLRMVNVFNHMFLQCFVVKSWQIMQHYFHKALNNRIISGFKYPVGICIRCVQLQQLWHKYSRQLGSFDFLGFLCQLCVSFFWLEGFYRVCLDFCLWQPR